MESKMKKMRKYSGATGIKAVPNIPSTFVPKSSPHFVAALSGKGQEHPQRNTSVYRSAATANPPKNHSTVFRSNLPMIQVTMEEVEERSRLVQRKVSSSSTGSSWTRVGLNSSDTSERYKTASNPTEKQRETSVKERVLLGETPLGKDMLFRRKISNTATPKITNAEEKERLLMKYTSLNNAPMSAGHSNKKQMKSTYFSRYNIPTDAGKNGNFSPLLSKGSRASELYTNWTTRGRAQSLNFVPNADIRIKEKTTKEVFGSKTFPADSITSDVYSRDRAQTLNFVIQGGEMSSAGSAKMRLLKDRTKGLYEITEKMRKQNQRTVTEESNNLQIEPANNLSASLFLYSQNATIENAFEGKLSPIRAKMNIKLPRKDSQDRNAFLTFPTLRAKSWTEN